MYGTDCNVHAYIEFNIKKRIFSVPSKLHYFYNSGVKAIRLANYIIME